MGMVGHGGQAAPRVIGRWEYGGSVAALHGQARIASARPIGSSDGTERLLELHPVPAGADAEVVVGSIRRAASVSGAGLSTIVDVGSGQVDDRPVVYVVTPRWETNLATVAHGWTDDDLLGLGRELAAGLGTLHRADVQHGAIHRAAVRRAESGWELAPAGLAPLIQTEIAPYRPPGLNVIEDPGPAADMWSLGVLLHELAAGRLLRPGETPSVPPYPSTNRLLLSLLDPDPARRISADEVAAGRLEAAGTGADPTVAAPGASRVEAGGATRTGGPPSRPSAPDRPTPAATGVFDAVAPSGTGRRTVIRAAVGVAVVLTGVGAFALLSGGDDQPDLVTEAAEAVETAPVEETAPGEEEGDGSVPDDGPMFGPIGLTDAVVGDCLMIDLTRGLVDQANRVDCAEPHPVEVIAMIEATDGEYPGRQRLLADGRAGCDAEFEVYAGGSVLDSLLTTSVVVPTFGQWDGDGLRTTVCLGQRFDGGDLTGSIAGAARTFRLLPGSEAPVGKTASITCFNADQELDTVGLRQVVTLVGCTNPHRFELLDILPLPLSEEQLSQVVVDVDIFRELQDSILGECTAVYEDMTPLEGSAEPEIIPIVPDEFDWSLGDQALFCVAEWPETVVGSVALNTMLAERADNDG